MYIIKIQWVRTIYFRLDKSYRRICSMPHSGVVNTQRQAKQLCHQTHHAKKSLLRLGNRTIIMVIVSESQLYLGFIVVEPGMVENRTVPAMCVSAPQAGSQTIVKGIWAKFWTFKISAQRCGIKELGIRCSNVCTHLPESKIKIGNSGRMKTTRTQ